MLYNLTIIANMMDYICSVGAFFWLPPIFWVTLFLWARFLAYPVALKRRIRMGKNWCYVPEWWSKKPLLRLGTLFFLVILGVLAAFSSAASLFSLFPSVPYWFVFMFLAFLIVVKPLTEFAMNGIYRLQVNAYFLEYKKQSEYYSKLGRPLSEDDLNGHTAWAFRNAMKKAESEKQLLKYLRERSKMEIAAEKERSAYEQA
ncbi:hypothetical protein [Hallerella succinigenes]|nr:hypothetical protein [Hallerella succinigenes]